MVCPVCGCEMEKGFFQGYRFERLWVKNRNHWKLSPQEGVFAEKMNPFTYFNIDAYLCRSCKKVVIDYADTTPDIFVTEVLP